MTIDDRRAPGDLPVAGVVVDSPLAHLDRVFEYAVPPQMSAAAAPGVRVRVRFAGRDLDGFVVTRSAHAEHGGALRPLRRVVSPEAVLTPEVLAAARAVADRHAGTLADVLRLAVPKRHAAAERALPLEVPAQSPLPAPEPGPWAAYPAGAAFLRRVSGGQAPAAAWLALPGQPPDSDWPAALARVAAAALAGGRGALVVVPDRRDVQRVDVALRAQLGPGRHVLLTADQGPQARYTAWLRVLRGHVRCVVGTRAAAYAPVRDLGLVAWWDDGDDLHAEPHAPHAHVREVLAVRARQTGAALLTGGFTRSVAIQDRVEAGLLVDLRPTPATLRAAAPRIRIAGEGADRQRDPAATSARLPTSAWEVARRALSAGPVLVQVPRSGYLPVLRCADCRTTVRCPHCHGPVEVAGPTGAPTCTWCGGGWGVGGFRCPQCAGQALRSAVVGAGRTAEELGRAFPGVPVVSSARGAVVERVGADPALVIATPGAEPHAADGYAAGLLLDTWAVLDRPELDAAIESLRRWCTAAALVRPAAAGGTVVLCGLPAADAPETVSLPPVEALVRWDPPWLAARELAERRELGLPPAAVMAELRGDRTAAQEAVEQVLAVVRAERLGPIPVRDPRAPEAVRTILRVPPTSAEPLARALAAVRARRSARKAAAPLQVRMHWEGDG